MFYGYSCFMIYHERMLHIQSNMVAAEKFQLRTIIIGAVINSLKKRFLQIRNIFSSIIRNNVIILKT